MTAMAVIGLVIEAIRKSGVGPHRQVVLDVAPADGLQARATPSASPTSATAPAISPVVDEPLHRRPDLGRERRLDLGGGGRGQAGQGPRARIRGQVGRSTDGVMAGLPMISRGCPGSSKRWSAASR